MPSSGQRRKGTRPADSLVAFTSLLARGARERQRLRDSCPGEAGGLIGAVCAGRARTPGVAGCCRGRTRPRRGPGGAVGRSGGPAGGAAPSGRAGTSASRAGPGPRRPDTSSGRAGPASAARPPGRCGRRRGPYSRMPAGLPPGTPAPPPAAPPRRGAGPGSPSPQAAGTVIAASAPTWRRSGPGSAAASLASARADVPAMPVTAAPCTAACSPTVSATASSSSSPSGGRAARRPTRTLRRCRAAPARVSQLAQPAHVPAQRPRRHAEPPGQIRPRPPAARLQQQEQAQHPRARVSHAGM